jgi:signal transduction histidine kinase
VLRLTRARRGLGGWLSPSTARLRAQVAQLAHQLEEAERFATLGRVGAGLLHDLGKPLGVIERLAGRLPGHAGDVAAVQRDARTIAELAGEMRAALHGCLAAARGEGAADGEAPELEALVERAVRAVSPRGSPARVAVRLAPDLPRWRGEGAALVRVLANLLDNALRAGGASDVVDVVASAHAGCLRLEVCDRGCGMPAGIAQRAFEPFFTTRDAAGGSGLGLAICRDLVRGLGGSIELESAPGAGTRVRVRLPLEHSGPREAARREPREFRDEQKNRRDA